MPRADQWPIRHQASAFSGPAGCLPRRYAAKLTSASSHWVIHRVGLQRKSPTKMSMLHSSTIWNIGITDANHHCGAQPRHAFHGRRLLQEHFDGTPSPQARGCVPPRHGHVRGRVQGHPQKRHPDVGCLCTWMTYGHGFLPRWLKKKMMTIPTFNPCSCTHPVTWTKTREPNDLDGAPWAWSRPSYRLSKPAAIQAWITPEGVIWVDAPQVLGGRWLQRDNWHSGDLNLFWLNMHVNAQLAHTRMAHETRVTLDERRKARTLVQMQRRHAHVLFFLLFRRARFWELGASRPFLQLFLRRARTHQGRSPRFVPKTPKDSFSMRTPFNRCTTTDQVS